MSCTSRFADEAAAIGGQMSCECGIKMTAGRGGSGTAGSGKAGKRDSGHEIKLGDD